MMQSADVAAAKKTLRSGAKTIRAEAFAKHGSRAARAIAAHGLGFLPLPAGTMVSGFSAIGEEIDPTPLLTRLLDEGHEACLPVMQGKGLPLLFRGWRPGDETLKKTWGIREPLPTAPEAHPDVVLAALLAFDALGWRLGYGGGFYDRTLRAARSSRPVIAVGLAYDEQEVDAVPHLDYDERLDWVLTPSGARRCAR